MEERAVEVGQAVSFCDEGAAVHDALVMWVYGSGLSSINLIYVSGNEKEEDQYGREMKRECSVVHKSNQEACGNYWKFRGATRQDLRHELPEA